MTTRLEDLDTLTLEGKRADLWPVIAGSKTSATRKRWAEALDKRIKAELDRRNHDALNAVAAATQAEAML